MRVQVLDGGAVVADPPGGRVYFMIPVPPQSPAERKITVDSFVLQSLERP